MTIGKSKCAYCGAPYGKRAVRTVREFIPGDDDAAPPPPLPYKGNARVVSLVCRPDDAHWQRGDRCLETQTGFHYIGAGIERPKGVRVGRVIERELWTPGDYRKSYEPFCTLRCAGNFAVSAHRAGYRIKR